MKCLGLYLHIPFCFKKCGYCDFLSLDHRSKEDRTAYIDALLREVKYYAHLRPEVDSVYIGGGTPSLLEPALIARIMEGIKGSFSLKEAAEITIEANPGSLDAHKLSVYRDAGINRLSLGAQSLNDETLKYLGRIHTVNTFIENFFLAREKGFSNISVDLMFAIPGQSHAILQDSLEKTIALGPEHISFYSLQIEEGTPFFRLRENGTLVPVGDEEDRSMYHNTVRLLEDAGYHHYEISNAARADYESRHNLKYWSMDEYLGMGLGAHSYLDRTRFSNHRDLGRYIRAASESSFLKKRSKISPLAVWCHENTRSDDMSEFLFTGLRKVKGIALSDFSNRFGTPLFEVYSDEVEKHMKSGLLEMDRSEDFLRLTAKGMDLFNHVLVDFV